MLLTLAHLLWQALKDAVIPAPGSTNMAKAMHFLNVPWKL